MMRLQRYGFILLAVYALFLSGGYATNVPSIRFFDHFFFTALAISWLGWRWYRGKGIPSSPLNIVIFALLGIGFLSVLFSTETRMAIEHMWRPLIYTMGFLFIVNAFHHAQDRLVMDITFIIAVTVIFLAGIQISSAFFGLGLVRLPSQGWVEFLGTGIPFPVTDDMRVFLPLGVSTQTAGFVSPLIILTLAWALSISKGIVRNAFGVLFALLVMVMIMTFSRGGLLSVMAGLVTFFGLQFVITDRIEKLFTARNLRILGGLLALGIVVVGAVLVISSNRSRQDGDSLRLDLWRSAINMTIDHPLTGVGTGIYGTELRSYRNPDIADDRLSTAHNIYLNMMAENGLLVLIAWGVGGWILVQTWWQLRKDADGDSVRYIRLNGAMAALIAFGVHNMVDTMTTFAALMLLSVLLVYCTVQPAKSRLQVTQASSHRHLNFVAIGVLLVYGLWFIAIVDPAHRDFLASRDTEQSLETRLVSAQAAVDGDSAVGLYHLQVAFLSGQIAIESSDAQALQNAIDLHLDALERAPTWDIGMINLAGLYEQVDDIDGALHWLTQASAISRENSADLHWARLSDAIDPSTNEDIIVAYHDDIRWHRYLPLSDFWLATPNREAALLRYTEDLALNRQYRIYQVHYPDELSSLLPENPSSAAEWWVVGEYALTIENDAESGVTAFTEAIALRPEWG
ncbi:MAG: O-antigen ligase family protein, partial [Chloroflexota bacterium]